MASDFDRIADELYGLAPADFTARRNAEASEARRRGDRDLAASITALKRPTSSAWLVNQLVRQRAEALDDLLELGEAMRQAQDQLAGGDLRRLSQQRRQVVEALAAEARQLATAVGKSVSEEATRELEATLEAALADPVAGDAVRSGRLSTALSSSGLGSLDFGAVASVSVPTPPAPASLSRVRAPAPAGARGAGGSGGGDDERRRLRQEAAEEVLRGAEAEAVSTAREAVEAEQRATSARDERRRLRQAITELETHLARRQTEEMAAVQQLRAEERSAEAARRSAKAAERRAEQARRTLERLRD